METGQSKPVATKTVRSRFNHEVGGRVEGCVILEKRVIIPPDPVERRLGVYDYLVEVPPTVIKPKRTSQAAAASSSAAAKSDQPPSAESFTRATPEEMSSRVIRRVPSR